MSIRCSLLGHSYGEAEIEREREEQGSEVVVTVREFEECERCGDRKIVTENKEVTALQSPAPDLESAESDSENVSQSDAASATPNVTGGTETVAATDAEVTAAADDDAEIMTDSTDSGGASASDSTGSSSDASASNSEAARSDAAEAATEADTADGDFEQGPSAAEDDGVILDDDDDDDSTAGDRTPGEWPEAETTHPAETDEGPGEWPAVGREDDDAGYDAEPGDSGNADVEFGGGLTPESAPEVDDDEAEEVEFVNAEGDALQSKGAADGTTELSSGISAGADAPSVAGPADDPDVDAEFVCPECDYREGVAGSSLRAGDICPECARGYLAQE